MRRFVLAAIALTVLAACQPADTALSAEDVAAVNNVRTSYAQGVIWTSPVFVDTELSRIL